MPEELRPAASTAPSSTEAQDVDRSLLGIVTNWHLVVADLAQHFGVDLYDPAVLDRPWPGVRTMILALVAMPESRLHQALTRK